MPLLPTINIQDFNYELPDLHIAKYPLSERDASKLLVWQQGEILHEQFLHLPDLLQGDEVLYFNNTKVIPARLFFTKETGSLIETFLLSPLSPALVEQAMQATGTTTWACAIGNLKRWKDGLVLRRTLEIDGREVLLQAHLSDRQQQVVRYEWSAPQLPFVKIIEAGGVVPIPPYLNRNAEASDRTTYQTVYSKREGAVAAPTAGLHFTPKVLEAVANKGVRLEELTLHVSAGTFKPVTDENAIDHEMHVEQVAVSRKNVEALLHGRRVIAVGTTSMRTLESLYWFGVRLRNNPTAEFSIGQYEPYHQNSDLPDLKTAATQVLDFMTRKGLEELHGTTQIYIVPGYQFRVCDALITNFHQPCSTLLLLVSAFVGGDDWRSIYDAALNNDYRFLSYGDSSLLVRG
ncbi:MAG: S-adenosylmethionine:tRNA ribosyltransferase-isomerase [Saprospiraceae bacterium]